MKVYISGAIAHYDMSERKAAFGHAARYLELKGCEVVNPFDNPFDDDEDWHVHMKYDIQTLLECDAIYMLEGWWHSKGAKLELDVASSCGLAVWFEGRDDVCSE